MAVLSKKKKTKVKQLIQKKESTRKAIPKAVRDMVWDFYIGTDKGRSKCFCCNNHEVAQNNFECGHVIADKKGGASSVQNLRPVCSLCNKSMQTTNMIKFIKDSGYKLNDNFFGRPEILKTHYPNGFYKCLECGNIQHRQNYWLSSFVFSEKCKSCKQYNMSFVKTVGWLY